MRRRTSLPNLARSCYRAPMRGFCMLWLVALVGLGGCAAHLRADARPGDIEEGDACWYGRGFQGQRTASGEVFDMYDLTAAHRGLRFGTWVEVENLRNGRQVVVR